MRRRLPAGSRRWRSRPSFPAAAAAAVTADDVLRALVIKGFGTPDSMAPALLSTPDEMGSLLDRIVADGLAELAGGMFRLTPDGKAIGRQRIADDQETWGVERAGAALQEAGLTMIPGMEGDGIYPERVSQADIVVIQREFPLYWEQHQQILSLARTQGKPVVYELDDLLLELPDVHPDRAIDFYTPAILRILHAITSSDLVTTTTPTLREYLIQFNPNVMVLPNYLDDHIWQMRSPVKDLHDFPVVIGYMGSDTHQPDLDILIPVFLNLVNRYGEKIRFRFWGCQPPEVIRQLSNTDWLPLQIFDYPKFAEY